MSVFLSILQGIGWLLLVLSILLLLMVSAVLFAPVRYELEGDIREKQWAKAKVHWFLHLFRARVVYEDDLVFVEIKILWITRNFSFEPKKEGEDLEADIEKEGKETAKEVFGEETKKEGIISKIKGMINRIKELYPKIKKIITDDRNKAAVLHIKDELIYLVKIVLPKETKVDAVFSTGSPDTTGQAYGVLTCLPVIYQDNWLLLPDFMAEEAYFHGYFRGIGRIYGYQLAGIVFRIVFDKNCQRMYTMINKFVKSFKHKPGQEDK